MGLEGSGIIRELVTLLGFKVDEASISKYEARIVQAKVALRRFAWASAIAGGAIAAVAARVIRAGSEFVDSSARIGIGIEALQEWRYAAQQSGIDAQSFTMAMQQFGRSAADTSNGIGRAKVAFAQLAKYGMGSLVGSDGKLRDLNDLLPETMTALSRIENPAERNAIAMKLFGGQGLRVVQMLKGGMPAINKLRERFRALGGVMDKDLAESAERAGDAWNDMKAAFAGVGYVLARTIMPTLERALLWLADFIAKHRQAVGIIMGIVTGLLALYAVLRLILALRAVTLAFLAVANTGLGLLVLKLLAIPALIAAILAMGYLIGEDLGAFLSGKKSMIGVGIDAMKQALLRLTDWIWGKLNEFLDWAPQLADSIRTTVTDAFFALQDIWAGVVAWMKERLLLLIPQWMQDWAQAQTAQKYATFTPMLDETRRLAAGGAANTSNVFNISIAGPPGETAASIAQTVALEIAKVDISRSLIGLSP